MTPGASVGKGTTGVPATTSRRHSPKEFIESNCIPLGSAYACAVYCISTPSFQPRVSSSKTRRDLMPLRIGQDAANRGHPYTELFCDLVHTNAVFSSGDDVINRHPRAPKDRPTANPGRICFC